MSVGTRREQDRMNFFQIRSGGTKLQNIFRFFIDKEPFQSYNAKLEIVEGIEILSKRDRYGT